jgi:predicted DNA-binding protein YlxM (UPF0122 family)
MVSNRGMIMRSNFMSKIAIFHAIKSTTNSFYKIDHKIEIGIFQEIKTFCKIDQEIKKAPRGLYFRLFYLT